MAGERFRVINRRAGETRGSKTLIGAYDKIEDAYRVMQEEALYLMDDYKVIEIVDEAHQDRLVASLHHYQVTY